MPIILPDKPICENMRKIRLEKGLTQKQVADACGMVDATYRTYELGKANPKPATVARIAKALGVSVEAVYGVEWAGGTGTQPSDISSALYQSILINQGGALSIDSPYRDRLLAAYGRLNEAGQLEAIKRVEELGLIPAYQPSPSPGPGLFDSLTEDERYKIKSHLNTLRDAELELKSMKERKPPLPDDNHYLTGAKKMADGEMRKIAKILLRALERQTETSPTE